MHTSLEVFLTSQSYSKFPVFHKFNFIMTKYFHGQALIASSVKPALNLFNLFASCFVIVLNVGSINCNLKHLSSRLRALDR